LLLPRERDEFCKPWRRYIEEHQRMDVSFENICPVCLKQPEAQDTQGQAQR
jgi:hypothetical protein